MSNAWGVTNFSEVVQFSYEWNIINLSRCLKIYQQIDSPPMIVAGTGGLVCHLRCKQFAAGIISKIQVNQVEKVVEEASLFTISLICVNDKNVKLAGNVDVLCDDVWLKGGFGDSVKDNFIARSNMRDWTFTAADKINYYASVNQGFVAYQGFWHTAKSKEPLQIKVELFSPGDFTMASTMISPTSVDTTSELLTSMKTLMLDTKHSDVVLRCQGQEFPCHKAILCARSLVFSKMLDTDMKETEDGLVEIDDVDPDTIELLIEYIYTGEVTGEIQDLSKLVYVGDKYQLKGLVNFCFKKFDCDKDDSQTQVVDMLILADKHSLDAFKDVAKKRILMDKLKFISDDYFQKKLENNPKLLFELFKA